MLALRFIPLCIRGLLLALVFTACAGQEPAQLHIAAASSLKPLLDELALAFEKESGHQLLISYGSSGALCSQIIQGAGYEIFLSADDEYPRQLASQNKTRGEALHFADGSLMLCMKKLCPDTATWEQLLMQAEITAIAIPNPRTAPFGRLARSLIRKAAGADSMMIFMKLVPSTQASSALEWFSIGAAEACFTPHSHLPALSVPCPCLNLSEAYQTYIHYTAVSLTSPDANPAKEAFMKFLTSAAAQDIFRRKGYSIH